MKKFMFGVATTLVASWAWKKFNLSEKVQPYLDKVKTRLDDKLAELKKEETVED